MSRVLFFSVLAWNNIWRLHRTCCRITPEL